eukprot:m.189532 g.189532  ORF g.189532 m.189532 type:complete len:1041 (+) comp15110_c0_seq2:129-3251(+)
MVVGSMNRRPRDQHLWLLATLVSHAVGCTFHCETSPCGPEELEVRNHTVFVGMSVGNENENGLPEQGGLYRSLLSVDVSSRNITSLAPEAFGCWNFSDTTIFTDWSGGVILDNNPLETLPDGAVFGGAIVVSLRNCSISHIPPTGFTSYDGLNVPGVKSLDGLLFIELSNNFVTTIGPGALNSGSDFLSIQLANNLIDTVESEMFHEFRGGSAFLGLANNRLSELPAGMMGGFHGGVLMVDVSNNNLSHVGALFAGNFSSTTEVHLTATNCRVNATGASTIINSYSVTATLYLDLGHNDVTVLPYNFFNFISFSDIFGTPVQLKLDIKLTHNPIGSIDSDFFSIYSIVSLTLDVSHATAGPISYPSYLSFQVGVLPTPVTLVYLARNTSATLSVVGAFSHFLLPFNETAFNSGCGVACNLTLDLSDNSIAHVPSGSLHGALVTKLIMQNNEVTQVAPDAFDLNLVLRELDMSNNNLSAITTAFLQQLPVLTNFRAAANQIQAVPVTSNYHILDSAALASNLIQCASYGPQETAGCQCASNTSLLYYHCGYAVCLSLATYAGCPNGTVLNSSDCTLAPWSSCVPASVLQSGEYFYSLRDQSIQPLTQCSAVFDTENGKGSFAKAYEFHAPTLTSNRVCSICSTCPGGFKQTECTATSDSKCVRDTTLSPAAIAALAMAIVLVIFVGGVASTVLYYGKRRKQRELGQTQTYLELTERLLDDEREEKERWAGAYMIPEADVTLGGELGSGAFGRVLRGMWGHIPVAVKILRRPMDDLDLSMQEDFDREVAVMRSIRHPNVLTFFGAGVNSAGHAYLVTELMTMGSLGAVLHDKTRDIDWRTRLQFAEDIACGMRYLHEIGTVHRDLKADNCFCDQQLRVKVADFGTGRWASSLKASDFRDVSNTPTLGGLDRGRTLSKGVGSLMWMAPEMLRGDRITEKLAPALDVYSFAIVLFEIWTRLQPYNEIVEEGVHFSVKLMEVTSAGHRPQIPRTMSSPAGYATLMEECWADNPLERPKFSEVADRVAAIRLRSESSHSRSSLKVE